jgi:hypothetical protein
MNWSRFETAGVCLYDGYKLASISHVAVEFAIRVAA